MFFSHVFSLHIVYIDSQYVLTFSYIFLFIYNLFVHFYELIMNSVKVKRFDNRRPSCNSIFTPVYIILYMQLTYSYIGTSNYLIQVYLIKNLLAYC